MNDTIYRQAAIDALWKTLYEYEDKTEKQFQESEDSDVGDWMLHRIFVQHMNDIDRQTILNLSSAQPGAIRINLNEPIKVKLTDWGKEIYYRQYNRVNQIVGREICEPNFPKEDENGYTEFQLWCFIELYGMHMGMTLPNVIEPLEIVYEGREGS